ncbi:uncharacterized protein BJX67DRAFT_378221 [Aspergillus lucknowensis]|uniref:Uncharacterized protein n=1 Tax=Aspergillus lucknowensis TaxID=176173 RepID=A0ABR4M0C4_9EURO
MNQSPPQGGDQNGVTSNQTGSAVTSQASTAQYPRPGIANGPFEPGKPVILVLTACLNHLTTKYPSIINKMRRDANLVPAFTTSPDHLDSLITNPVIFAALGGIIVTDASIMDPENPAAHSITKTLLGFLNGTGPFWILWRERLGENRNNINDFPRNVVFAFDFPAQAARQPLRFGKYMAENFGLSWKICGATMGKVDLVFSERVLRKMGGRRYRGGKYVIRGVFLEGVAEGDKVLLVDKRASIKNGGLGTQGQPDVDVDHGVDALFGGVGLEELRAAKRDGDETDSTVMDECEVHRVDVQAEDGTSWTVPPSAADPADPAGAGGAGQDGIEMVHPEQSWDEYDLADDELTGTELDDESEDEEGEASTTSEDTDDWLLPNEKHVIYINPPDHREWTNTDDTTSPSLSPREPKNPKSEAIPKRIANCPVAVHEVKSKVEKYDQSLLIRGYIGFVGHVEDNRSMAGLILGMCGVMNTKPLPEAMRSVLRNLV